MKLRFASLLGVALALAYLAPAADGQASAPQKRALLVAVNGYKRGRSRDVHNLDTLPDVEAIKKLLMSPRFGFKENEIKVLATPAETTHRTIVDTFRSFLIAPTRPGDILFFHYSGHGSEVEDKNDVLGFDQTLVPSDYVSQDDGSNDIRDKDLARLLEELRQKQPGSVLLSFDSCHSGTVTRGRMLVRGFERPIARSAGAAGATGRAGGLLGPGEAGRLGYVVLSACRSDQLDYEAEDDNGKPMGSLTYALCKALGEANEKTTYRDLFNRITSLMREKGLQQEPQIEGEVDQVLFGSAVIRPEAYIPIDLEDARTARLQAGFLMGMTKGSQLDIFARGTKDFKTAQPIAKAEVAAPSATTSALKVTLMPGSKMEDLRGAYAVITQRVFPDNPLRVDVSSLDRHPRHDAIMTALKEMEGKLLTTRAGTAGAGWDVRIIDPARLKARGASVPPLPEGADNLVLVRPDGSFLTVETAKDTYRQVLADDARLPANITRALERESRWRLVNGLHNPASESPFKVEARIIPCEVEPDPQTKVRWTKDRERKPTPGGQIQMKVGEYFRVEVRNSGDQQAYATILDLQSSGMIGPVWPLPGAAASNIVPSDSRWHPLTLAGGGNMVFVVTEPTGPETFKVIATEKPADFSPLLDPETVRSRGAPRGNAPGAREAQTPLGKLLMSAAARTRAAPATVSMGDWTISSFHFTVLPAEAGQKP